MHKVIPAQAIQQILPQSSAIQPSPKTKKSTVQKLCHNRKIINHIRMRRSIHGELIYRNRNNIGVDGLKI